MNHRIYYICPKKSEYVSYKGGSVCRGRGLRKCVRVTIYFHFATNAHPRMWKIVCPVCYLYWRKMTDKKYGSYLLGKTNEFAGMAQTPVKSCILAKCSFVFGLAKSSFIFMKTFHFLGYPVFLPKSPLFLHENSCYSCITESLCHARSFSLS